MPECHVDLIVGEPHSTCGIDLQPSLGAPGEVFIGIHDDFYSLDPATTALEALEYDLGGLQPLGVRVVGLCAVIR